MSGTKERRLKNVKFGLSKDDSFEMGELSGALSHSQEEGSAFVSVRDYWKTMCKIDSSPDRKADTLCMFVCVFTINFDIDAF